MNLRALSIEKDFEIKGKIFAFTGKLPITRKEAETAIIKAGGSVVNTVTTTTNYVVKGAPNPNHKMKTSSKAKAARNMNISVISQDMFMLWYNTQIKITEEKEQKKPTRTAYEVRI